MRPLELGLAVFWLVLGIAVCAQSLELGMVGPFGPASGFFPFIAGSIMAVAAAGLLLSPASRVDGAAPFWSSGEGMVRVLLTVALMVLLILLTPRLGFLLAGILVTPAMLRLVGGAGWTMTALVGVGTPAAIHLLFVVVLNSPLPRGPL